MIGTPDQSQLQRYLDDVDRRVELADERVRLALYHHYKLEPGPEVAEAESSRAEMLLDPALTATLDEWKKRQVSARTRRQLDLWRKLSVAARIRDVPEIRDLRTELNAEIVKYRPLVGDRPASRTEVREILRVDPDGERRRLAWLAYVPLAERLERRVRELLKRRNSRARSLGFASYVDLSLELDGLSRAEMESLFARVDEMTRRPYERFVASYSNLEPWDVSHALDFSNLVSDERFRQSDMLGRLETYRQRIGVPDRLPIRIEFTEVPFGGLTNFIKIPDDIRILMNAADNHSYYVTLFHEYGHAIHNASIRQPSFILQKESGPYSESMAQVSAYFASHPRWLSETAGVDGAEFSRFAQTRLANWILRLRQLLATASFEYSAYANPDADLDAALAEFEARYLLVRPHAEQTRWAADSFYSIYPIYLHNYVYADVVASQVHAALRRALGEPYGNPDTFGWLAERLYGPGVANHWRTQVEDATGSELDSRFLEADLQWLEERCLT